MKIMSDDLEERFSCVLKEAKAIFDDKSKEEQKLRIENGELQQTTEQLKTENKELVSKQESLLHKMQILEGDVGKFQIDSEKLTDQLTKSKKFFKNFFTELQKRMIEIQENGVYNTETFSYLVGDVGRSLGNTSFVEDQKTSPSKKQGTHKLSTNKVKKRSRYKDVAPLDLSKATTTARRDIETVDSDTCTFKFQDVKLNKNLKKAKPLEKKSEKTNPIVNNLDDEKTKNYLDPDLTLCSPIGPPSRASTPQGPCPGGTDEWKSLGNSNMAAGNQNTPLHELSNDLKCFLLARLSAVDGENTNMSEPQSPTIPSRSHSIVENKGTDADGRKTKRKRNLDVTFGSLLEEPKHLDLKDDHCLLVSGCSPKVKEERKKQDLTVQHPHQDPVISPDIIILEDSSDFVKPNTANVQRKTPKTCSASDTRPDTSSILLFSPKRSKSPVISLESFRSDEKSDGHQEKDDTTVNESGAENDKPKLSFHLNIDESSVEKKPLEREEQCDPYKYTEVVRGKDKRAKLNGYFCADCEKYYGSLKLSEEEFQERLKACSRHRARFSPPPSTPEHFWQVDFMDTHEYIEKGFMRSESELPPGKRKLKSRKTKGKTVR